MSAVHRVRRPIAAALWMIGAQILFAAMGLFVRLASREINSFQISAVRALIGLSVALVVAKVRGVPLRVVDQRLAWSRSLFGTLAMVSGFFAMASAHVSLGDTVTLFSTSPIFIALLSPLILGEKNSPLVYGAILVSFLGASLIAGPHFQLSGSATLLAMVSALSSAFAMVWLRKLSRAAQGENTMAQESPEAIVIHFSAVATVISLVLGMSTLKIPSFASSIFLIGAGMSAGIAQLAMTRAYALDHAAIVGAYGLLNVVFAHVTSVWILKEGSSVTQLAGALLVIAGGLLLTLRALRSAVK